jgi:hypothetical protein
MRLISALLVGSLAWLLSTTASAQDTRPPDFVFNVPVRISNAPALVGGDFFVTCSVEARAPSGSGTITSSSRDGSLDVPLHRIGPSGFTGTIRVEVRLLPTVRRSDVIRWRCGVTMPAVRSVLSGRNEEWAGDSGRYTAHTGQAVTTSRLDVGADFAR